MQLVEKNLKKKLKGFKKIKYKRNIKEALETLQQRTMIWF